MVLIHFLVVCRKKRPGFSESGFSFIRFNFVCVSGFHQLLFKFFTVVIWLKLLFSS